MICKKTSVFKKPKALTLFALLVDVDILAAPKVMVVGLRFKYGESDSLIC